MTRGKAFLIHLGISFFIFAILLYVTFLHWYPGFLFADDGGWQGIRLIAGITLVLGPFLTLILFKPGKAGLKFDLWVIGIIQTAALCWGTWTVYTERPYVIVFAENFFKPLTEQQFIEANAPPNSFNTICKNKPCLIFSALPEEIELLQKARAKAFRKGGPIQLLGEYYQPFSAKHVDRLKKASLDVSKVLKKNIDKEVKRKFISYQEKDKSYLFFRISSRYKQQTAVFDTESFRIIDTIDYAPPAS